MRKVVRAFLVVVLLTAAGKVPAQFMDIGGGFIDAGVHGAVMNGITSKSAKQREATGPAPLSPAQKAALQFAPSMEQRQRNYASFVEKTRAVDPAGADQLQQTLSQNDILAVAEAPFRDLGFDMYNVADAYALWFVTAWLAGQGRVDTPSAETLGAVRDQVESAFGTLPVLLSTDDATKQEAAEAHYLQSILISVTVEAAQSDAAYLEKVKAAVKQGAVASGMDLDAFELTETGFVLRQ